MAAPCDGFLLVSFGGPEGPAEVLPFLRNVTAGRPVPAERLEQVAGHYQLFGGVSPINQQCRDLLAAVQKDFAAEGVGLPAYWGNRNWKPYLADTLRAMADAGITHALAFVTSPYSSFSGCRQYLGDIERARAEVGPGAPRVSKIRQYFNHPGFIDPFVTAANEAIESLPQCVQNDAELVFVAHSVPEAMAAASGPAGGAYPAQLAEAARLVAERIGDRRWRLAYCSRSGPPAHAWLGPDINAVLADLAAAGAAGVAVVPIGFVSDHMEVRFDLDVEAKATAERLGLPYARAATPGTDPRFVAMITELVRERTCDLPRRALGSLGPGPDACPPGCCGGGSGPPASGVPPVSARASTGPGRPVT
jgi:ferrochelatase